MAGKRATGKRMRTPVKNPEPLKVLAVILLAIVLVLGGALVMLSAERTPSEEERTSEPQPEDSQENTVTVGGQQVEVDESLPANKLTEEQFTTGDNGRIAYSGAAHYGIDVSSHQGEIDWAAAAGDGVEFAMLRIGYRGYSEGALNQDAQFEANYAGARENGIAVGVYFFSQAVSEEEAAEEARQVLEWLDGRELDCPVVFDWEHITDAEARTDEVPGETVTRSAGAFCREIEKAGYEPMIYCNGMLGYLYYDFNELNDIPIWYAEYSDCPSYAYQVEMWQYSNTGSVSGISELVDWNIWFQDVTETP